MEQHPKPLTEYYANEPVLTTLAEVLQLYLHQRSHVLLSLIQTLLTEIQRKKAFIELKVVDAAVVTLELLHRGLRNPLAWIPSNWFTHTRSALLELASLVQDDLFLSLERAVRLSASDEQLFQRALQYWFEIVTNLLWYMLEESDGFKKQCTRIRLANPFSL